MKNKGKNGTILIENYNKKINIFAKFIKNSFYNNIAESGGAICLKGVNQIIQKFNIFFGNIANN